MSAAFSSLRLALRSSSLPRENATAATTCALRNRLMASTISHDLKACGSDIGIATTKMDELRNYDRSMQVLALCDAVACRDNARKGKPHPDLNHACLHQLGIKDASTAMVGRRHSPLCLSGKGLGIDGDRGAHRWLSS